MSAGKESSVIIDAVRSPIGLDKGKMTGMRPDNLLSQVLLGLLTRNQNMPFENIEDVIVGCAFPEGPQGMLIARSAALLAGIPQTSGAKVVNRFCGASMEAVHQADAAIRLSDCEVVIAGGVEDMLSIPADGFNPSFHPDLAEQNYYVPMGELAEHLAGNSGIGRDVQEEYAVNSHNKALDAWDNGYFNNEIIPVQYNNQIIARDEGPREPDRDYFSGASPSFLIDGSITSATSSPSAMGAAALLLTSESFAQANNLKPRARILSRAIAGVERDSEGDTPLPAISKALQRAELSLDDIDVIELNEAYAAQALYFIMRGEFPFNKINLNGGSIALGNPLGASGARILTTLLNVMDQQQARYGLAAMAIRGGQGIATIIERMSEEGE